MKRKQFRLLGMIVTMAMGGTIGWAVAIGNAVLAMAAAIVGTVSFYLLKSRVKEVIEDERIYRIGEKASRIALQIFAFTSAVTGVVLIALSNSGYTGVGEIGFTLCASACALLVLYLACYSYYGKKLGD